MSGPKRSDVEAQLNIARNSQRKCALLIGEAEESTLRSLLAEAEMTNSATRVTLNSVDASLVAIDKDIARVVSESLAILNDAVRSARRAFDEARSKVATSTASQQQAQSQSKTAAGLHARANDEFERAEAALRGSSGHYLSAQMQQAQAASRLYGEASQSLTISQQTRQTAISQATDSLVMAKNAASQIGALHAQVERMLEEARSRLQAEAEAARIAEEDLRRATLAIESARSAYNRLSGVQHEKFRPGAAHLVHEALRQAETILRSGDSRSADSAAKAVERRAGLLEAEVTRAWQDYERRRCQADTELTGLEAALASVDAKLITTWSDSPSAVESAQSALDSARRDYNSEKFEAASTRCTDETSRLRQAFRQAAENQAANERRDSISKAVMESLVELGFEVSYEPGTRTAPLRIAGQTPDERGRGDFEIEVPLNGEIDFTVNDAAGDMSCIAAVNQLQERLKNRGVIWNTTNWGHAEAAVPLKTRATTVEKQVEKQKERSKS